MGRYGHERKLQKRESLEFSVQLVKQAHTIFTEKSFFCKLQYFKWFSSVSTITQGRDSLFFFVINMEKRLMFDMDKESRVNPVSQIHKCHYLCTLE